jgi:2-C-methyl-D-erythritol 2,4-cyclodiphosphate synthase
VTDIRIGLGVDLHRADAARPLVLGGIQFEGEPGLAGHSDGDVLCHAVADALLGAAGLGDLGEHFPDSDPAHEGIAGLDLLARVTGLLVERGLAPHGCDLTLLAERPHIAARRDEIRRNIAAALSLPMEAVSVKATRPEGLGLTGDGAGCIALATVEPLSAR